MDSFCDNKLRSLIVIFGYIQHRYTYSYCLYKVILSDLYSRMHSDSIVCLLSSHVLCILNNCARFIHAVAASASPSPSRGCYKCGRGRGRGVAQQFP